MAEKVNTENAKKIFAALLDTLDSCGWKYETEKDELVVRFTVHGDDIPMEFVVIVDAERELVRSHSILPVKFSGEKLMDGAVATAVVNYKLADGNFEFNPVKGNLYFRLTASFKDSLISKEFFDYIIHFACVAVDEFNDKFFMLAQGVLDIKQFIDAVMND